MIELELRTPDAEGRYAAVATIRVDAGRVGYGGERPLFDTCAAAIDPRSGQPVRFEDDPETWARHLGSIYRASELMPPTTTSPTLRCGATATTGCAYPSRRRRASRTRRRARSSQLRSARKGDRP